MKRTLLAKTLLAALVAAVVLPSGGVDAQQEIAGVLALTPVEEHSCIAVQLHVGVDQPVQGISWYHNDSDVVFPRLLLLEGQEGQTPDLSQAALVLADLSGSSLGWGEAVLDGPVSSTTGLIDVVFELPAWTERTGTGTGGGPGLGYGLGEGPEHSWVTRDGASWVALHPDYRLAVSAIPFAARSMGNPPSLAGLSDSAPEGWWTDVKPTEMSLPLAEPDSETPSTALVSPDRPVAVVPNPFNPRTEVSFYVETGGMVTVDVFDVRGRRIIRLLDESSGVGARSVVWEGTDHADHRVASGVYFVRVQTPSGTHERRVALVR